ncbi:MAG: hypothetical protein WCG23_03650 [bacterium]
MSISLLSSNYEKQKTGFGMAVKVKPRTPQQIKELKEFLSELYGSSDNFKGIVKISERKSSVKRSQPQLNPIIVKFSEAVGYLNSRIKILPDSVLKFLEKKSETGTHIFIGHNQLSEKLLADDLKEAGFKVRQTPFLKD